MKTLKWLGMGICFGASLALLLFVMFSALSKLPLEQTKESHHVHHHHQPKYRGYR